VRTTTQPTYTDLWAPLPNAGCANCSAITFPVIPLILIFAMMDIRSPSKLWNSATSPSCCESDGNVGSPPRKKKAFCRELWWGFLTTKRSSGRVFGSGIFLTSCRLFRVRVGVFQQKNKRQIQLRANPQFRASKRAWPKGNGSPKSKEVISRVGTRLRAKHRFPRNRNQSLFSGKKREKKKKGTSFLTLQLWVVLYCRIYFRPLPCSVSRCLGWAYRRPHI